MRWLFVSLTSGDPIQIVTTMSERDRFMRYCNRERIRCGLIRVEEMGIVVDFDGDAVLGPVICHGNLPASGPKLLSVLAVDADLISRYLTNF